MASNRDNTVVLTTLLNGEQAERELKKLEEKAKDLDKALRAARKNNDFKLSKDLQKEFDDTKSAIAKFKKEVVDVDKVIRNLTTTSLKDLRAAQRELRSKISDGSIQRGTKEWDFYNKKLIEVRQEIKKISAESQVSESRLSRLTNGFNKYFAGFMTIIGTITGISFTLRKLSRDAAEMEDIYDGVSKTTNFTRAQVEKLNEAFKKMDTRVPREELNKFAAEAGKLGKETQEDILGFVNAAVKIRVGIGKDLGDDALTQIAKMTDIYAESTKEMQSMDLEERMIATGSAVRYLAKASTAAEPPMVNFANRMVGIASQADISIQNVLGFASVLDQLGQPVEMAATAFQKMIMKMFTDTSKFAGIAGMDVSKFSKLLRNDANEAIKTVLISLNEKGGFQDLAPIFKDMGLDGARAVGVLSALAANMDKVTQAQSQANKSFREGTALEDEYNIMNRNAQAEMEKRKQSFKDAAETLGKRLNPALLKSMNYITYLVKYLPDVLDFFQKWGKYILTLIKVYVTYTAATKLNVWWKQLELKTLIQLHYETLKYRAGLVLLNVQNVLSSKTTAQLTRSLQRLFATLKLNPFAVIATVVMALGVGIYQLTKRTTELTDKAAAMNDINTKVADSIAKEKAELNMLLGVARNEKISKEERLKAIAKLNDISPEYLGNLDLENINTGLATTAVKEYTEALMKNAKQKAIADKMSELYTKRLKEEASIYEIRQKLEQRRNTGKAKRDIDENLEYAIKRHETNMAAIDQEIEMYDELNQSIAGNQRKVVDRNIILENTLESEKKKLEELEERHAELYNSLYTEEEGFYVLRRKNENNWQQNNLALQSEFNNLNLLINAKRELIKTKEVELELRKKENKVEDENPTGGGNGTDKEIDLLKEKEATLKLAYEKEILILKKQLLEKEITQEEYNQKAYLLEVMHLSDMIELRNEFNAETVSLETTLTDKMISEANRRNKLVEASMKEMIDSIKKRRGEGDDEIEDFSPQSFKEEKALLQLRFEYGQLSEKEYQEALWKLREEYLDRYLAKSLDIANEITHISADLSEAVTSFQRAEEMSVTRKYDNMIKAAGNNSTKVAKLEEEKEAAIQKVKAKYADKEFILTVANVISATAMAAINAYASAAKIPGVGHILGPIAAAAATAYGAGQIAIAKQQHANAKQGYASGGYTGRGKWWEEAGPVHKNEFVGNRFAVQNPTVKRVFDVVDQAQRNNTVGSLSARDFQTALNYREHTQRRAMNAAISGISFPDGGDNSDVVEAINRNSFIYKELMRLLDEPIVAETYIEGKGGSKRANDLYNKMKKNVTR